MDRETALNALLNKISVPVARNTVLAGPVRTHYLAAGSGPPVVLLHGAGAGGVAWGPVFEHLAKVSRVIAPDIVGYGESDKPRAAYDRSFYADWLRGFLDSLGVNRASLIGHSQGGAIALNFALEHPERVRRLVLVGTAGLSVGLSLGALIGVVLVGTFPSKLSIRWASRYVLYASTGVDQDLIAYRLAVVRMPGGKRALWRGRGQVAALFSQDQLSQVSHPTLIIWGEEDRFFPLEQAQPACQAIPYAQLHIISDAGHCPFLDKPEEFSNAVIQFINA